jgi:hypothetical protein
MKTTKKLSQIAAEWRAINGNEVRKSSIASGKIFQYSASEIKEEVIRQSQINTKRIATRDLKCPSVKSFCRKLIRKRLEKIAEAMPGDGLSMGSVYYAEVRFFDKERAWNEKDSRMIDGKWLSVGASSWQGCKISGKDDRTHEYAKSSTYQAKHLAHTIKFTPSQLKNIKIIGGLITEIGEKINRHITKVRTLQAHGQKQHYQLVWKDEYLTDDFHADTVEACIAWRSQAARNLKAERQAIKAKAEFERYYEKAKILFYGIEHSLQAGNCEAGTLQFAGKKQLNPDYGYRGDFLLSIANGQTDFVKRMITKRAIQLQSK